MRFGLLICLLVFLIARPSMAVSMSPEETFFSACRTGDLSAIQKMVQDNPVLLNAENRDSYGEGCLATAARYEKTQLALWLVQHGANPTGSDRYDLFFVASPIYFAIRQKNHDLFESLLKAGARMDVVIGYYQAGTTEVDGLGGLVVKFGDKRMFDFLRMKGWDVHDRDNYLQDAAAAQNYDSIRGLLALGCKREDSMIDPIYESLRLGDIQGLTLLTQAGFDLTATLEIGFPRNAWSYLERGVYRDRTPMKIAVKFNQIDMIRHLGKLGAPLIVPSEEQPLVTFAIINGTKPATIRALVDAGAPIVTFRSLYTQPEHFESYLVYPPVWLVVYAPGVSEQDKIELIQYFYDRGFSLEEKGGDERLGMRTPLEEATAHSQESVKKKLLELGARP
ncbi:Ankyrin repeats (3 copies) [compost metagenome]